MILLKNANYKYIYIYIYIHFPISHIHKNYYVRERGRTVSLTPNCLPRNTE